MLLTTCKFHLCSTQRLQDHSHFCWSFRVGSSGIHSWPDFATGTGCSRGSGSYSSAAQPDCRPGGRIASTAGNHAEVCAVCRLHHRCVRLQVTKLSLQLVAMRALHATACAEIISQQTCNWCRYYRALTSIETRFPISKDPNHVHVAFVWFDAFRATKKAEQVT